MVKTISSQRYINYDVVDEKIKNQDFKVYVSPIFEVNGDQYRIIMDGHHSLEAAKELEVEPIFIEQTKQENDRIALINEDINLFLETCYIDSDWYDTETGAVVLW